LPMSRESITPLRQRMIEDMNARKLCAGTQTGHKGISLSGIIKCSPQTTNLGVGS